MTPRFHPLARTRPAVLLALVLTTAALVPHAASAAPAPSALSAAQKTKVSTRQAQFQKDIAALQADKKMTDAQKQARYKTLMATMDKDMLAILTPAQRAIVLKQRDIGAKFRQQAEVIQASKTLTEAQKKDRLAALAAQADKDTLATLPPSQRTEVLQRRQRQEQAQALKEQLEKSETPEQKKQFEATMADVRAKAEAVSGDKTLSEAAKGQKLTDLAKQAQAKDLALLTPAQKAMYEKIQVLIKP